jgi:hypothetical protein
MILIDKHGERPICTDCRRPFVALRPFISRQAAVFFSLQGQGCAAAEGASEGGEQGCEYVKKRESACEVNSHYTFWIGAHVIN